MNSKTPGDVRTTGVWKTETGVNRPAAPFEGSGSISVPHVGPVNRKDGLSGRLD
jgi:hypothetical protein